ncbi:MAG: sulfite exporter TauE/SafE family protein [Myxococcota bacterium]|nr:sulfite exporter TauE/SafE family protein [Myxococcota bacterium]
MPSIPGLSLPMLAALALVVLTAFTVETALGFGATLIAVALGSILLPIQTLLPSLVPLNLALSIWLASRYARAVDWRFLLRRLLPLMALGLPFGIALFRVADASLLKRIFGAFLIVVSVLELRRMRRSDGTPAAPLSRLTETAMAFAGGVVHGAFATGGPMAVYVTSRAIDDKGAYRATLCVLWAALNLVLLASFAISGEVSVASMTLSAWLVPSCALGLLLGEIAHHRVPVPVFRAGVFVALALAGVMLVVRG